MFMCVCVCVLSCYRAFVGVGLHNEVCLYVRVCMCARVCVVMLHVSMYAFGCLWVYVLRVSPITMSNLKYNVKSKISNLE